MIEDVDFQIFSETMAKVFSWRNSAVEMGERIKRALEVLQTEQTFCFYESSCDGGGILLPAKENDGEWVETEVLKKIRKILEEEDQ